MTYAPCRRVTLLSDMSRFSTHLSGAPAEWAHVWAQTCQLALVWWGLVLVSFLPAFVRVDKSKWLWPWKEVKREVTRAQSGGVLEGTRRTLHAAVTTAKVAGDADAR